MVAIFSSLRKVRVALLAIAMLALVGAVASSASAELVLDTYVKGSTSNVLIPITAATGTVGIDLWMTVYGTDGDTTNDGYNKIYWSMYSTNVDGGLTKIDFRPTGDQSAFSWNSSYGFPTGDKTLKGMNADLDGDGDIDLGSSDGTSAVGWCASDFGNHQELRGGDQILVYNFSQQVDPDNYPLLAGNNKGRMATIQLTRSAYPGQAMGHGITQIYAVGKQSETENMTMVDGVIVYDRSPQTGKKVTLYQVAAAALVGGDTTVGPDSGLATLDGSPSVGTMDHFLWQVRKHGDTGAWTNLLGDSITLGVDFAGLTALGLTQGDYDVRLTTTYTSGVVLPGDNASTSTTPLELHLLPEPGTIMLLLGGSAAMGWFRRRNKK
jgi:hypothetical protein